MTAVDPLVFTRTASERLTRAPYLQPFTGDYAFRGQTLTVRRNLWGPREFLLPQTRNKIECKNMPTSTLTSRGQTTIPKSIREELRLQPGDRIEFILEEDQVVIRRAGADITALDGMLDRSDREPVSVEAMNEAIERAAGSAFTNDTGDDA